MSAIRGPFRGYFLLVILVSVLGCEKELDYTFPASERLVVFGTLTPERGASIRVSRSLPQDGSEVLINDLWVEDAAVDLVTMGDTIQLLPKGEGRYETPVSKLPFVAGQEYKLFVTHAKWPPVSTSSITIPQPIPDDVQFSVRLTGELWLGNTGEPEVLMNLNWADLPGTTNYLIQLDALTDPTFPLQAKVVGEEELDICGLENRQPPNGIYFTDDCFRDQTIDLNLLGGIRDSVYFDIDLPPQPLGRLQLRLSVVDDNYIQFLRDQIPLETELGLGEASPTFTNVVGGYGIITGVNTRSITFRRPG